MPVTGVSLTLMRRAAVGARAVDGGDGGELPVVHDVLGERTGAVREGGRPNPGQHQAVALVFECRCLCRPCSCRCKASRWRCSGTGSGAFAVALAVVDFMRPGVGQQRLKPVGEALVDLHGQPVVVAVDAVFVVIDPAVAGIGPVADVAPGWCKCRSGLPLDVVDRVGEVGGGGGQVQVAHAIQLHAAAPDVRNSDREVLRKLALDARNCPAPNRAS